MHEMGIVFHIMDSLETVAQENQLDAIRSVTLEIGEVSAVIPEYLTDCWQWARKKKDFLINCEMIVNVLPAYTYCEDCKQIYPTVTHGKICPNCGSASTYLKTGNEINIKEVEV